MKLLQRCSWIGFSFLFCIQSFSGWPEIVSGRQNVPAPAGASGDTRVADVSPDKRFFLLISDAQNLASSATDGGVNLYLHHRETGETITVTAGLDGQGGDGATMDAFFSANGGLVIFESRARNLTPEGVSGQGDLFSYELATGETRLISVNRSGNAGGNGRSHGAVMTPDGRYVAFVSQAEDLVANDLNGASDIFRRDLLEESTRLVTVSWMGTGSAAAAVRPPLDASHSPSLSEDGRYVAFTSVAELLWATPLTGRPRQVYVRDMEMETNILVSVNVSGQPTRLADSLSPVIAGGRVYFLSAARDLTDEQLPAMVLYVRPIEGGVTTRVSAPPGTAARAAGEFQVLGDGVMVGYLYGGGLPWVPNVVRLWNNAAGTDTVISLNTNGAPSAASVRAFQLSTDGGRLAFLSSAGDLVAGVEGGRSQVYIAPTSSGTNQLVSRSLPNGEASGSDCLNVVGSDDLSVVAFSAWDGGLVERDGNRAVDAFAWEDNADGIRLLSAGASAEVPETPMGPSGLELRDVSGDGRYVLFTSMADDLVEQDSNGAVDVFLRDRFESIILTVSKNGEGWTGNGMSWGAVMTPDARYVAFYSRATDLADGDGNVEADVYLRDMEMGTTMLVSQTRTGQAAGGMRWKAPLVLSANGQWVGFLSTAEDLVENDTSGSLDFFIRDTIGGITYRTPPAPGTTWKPTDQAVGLLPSGRVYFLGGASRGLFVAEPGSASITALVDSVAGVPAISGDGRWIAYGVGGVGVPQSIVLLDNSAGQTIELMEGRINLLEAEDEGRLGISEGGQRVVFSSRLKLLTADTNQREDVYVVESTNPGVPILISVTGQGLAAMGTSRQAAISSDGRFVVFKSSAADLVGGDANETPDIFVRDLEGGITWLVSASPLSQGTGAGWSFAPRISDGGDVVVFVSDAEDLTGRDWNRAFDVFTWQQPSASPGDHDADGMDDAWEVQYFGGHHRDGLGDADADGLTDGDEFRTGTVPLDPSSVFALRYQWESGAGALLWPGTPDREYRLEQRTDLDEAGWEVVSGEPAVAEEGWMRHEDPEFGSAVWRWFRVILVE